MKISFSVLAAFCTLALVGQAPADARPNQARKSRSAGKANPIIAQVIIYDVSPEMKSKFESALESTRATYQRNPEFLNERVLGSLDDLALKYATYAKFGDLQAAERTLATRLNAVKPYVRRAPEVHLAYLTDSYTPAGIYSQPAGNEFGDGQVGQIAHLGLFVPFPKYWDNYERSLRDVKVVTRKRKPSGYLGDDLLVEASVPAPALQTPYSPRPVEPSEMSINYGEYVTLEDAENSYVQRHPPREDPKIAALARIFFGSLQVPTRFYIFKVIGNYSSPSAAARARVKRRR